MTDDPARIARRRAHAQLLHRPRGGTPESVVRAMLAVQAQDPRTGRLGLRARTPKLTEAALERALGPDGELVAAWLMRGTIHFVRRDDLPWLHALTTPRLRRPVLTRLGQEGVSEDEADRAVEIATAAIADEGPLTRADLRERIAPHGIAVESPVVAQITLLATLGGHLLMGPDKGTKRRFVRTEDWLGAPLGKVDRDAALAEMARRYLVTRGPATDRDLAVWSGLPLGDVRAGLAAIASEIRVDADGAAVLKGTKQRRGPSPLRFISTWDDLLLGWKHRPAWPEPSPFPQNFAPGVGRPAILVDGVAVGTYGLSVAGGKVRVTPELVDGTVIDKNAMAAEIADIERFFSGR